MKFKKAVFIGALTVSMLLTTACTQKPTQEEVNVLISSYYHYNPTKNQEDEQRIEAGKLSDTEKNILKSYNTAKTYVETVYPDVSYEFKNLTPISVNEESGVKEGTWTVQIGKKECSIRVSQLGDAYTVVYDGYVDRFVNELLSEDSRKVLLLTFPSDSEKIAKNQLTVEEKQFCAAYNALQNYMDSTYANVRYTYEDIESMDYRAGSYEYRLSIQGKEYLFKLEKNNKKFAVSIDGYRTGHSIA